MPDGTGEGDPPPSGGEGMVIEAAPVTEDQRWRKRALDAEERAAELEGALASAQQALNTARQDLAAAREAIDACERRREMDAALWEAGAADLETARLLTELAVSRMEAPDVRAAVADLALAKPFLFGRTPAAPGAVGTAARALAGASGARLPDGPCAPDMSALAEEAALSGDRAALLRYLRLRRARG